MGPKITSHLVIKESGLFRNEVNSPCYTFLNECNTIIFFFNFEVYNVSIEFVNLEDLDITRIAGVYKKTSYDHKRNFVGKIKRIFHNLGNKSRSFFFSVAAKRLMHGKRSRK